MPMFQTLTDDGNALQISDGFMNYSFIQKVTVNTTARSESSDLAKEGGIVANTRAWSLTVAGNNPVLVVTGNSSVVQLSRTKSGGNFTFTGWCGVNNAGTGAVSSFVAYVFDRPSVNGDGKYFVLRDAAGDVVFDASCRYMKVVGLINTAAGVTSVTIPSGKTYGTILGGCGGKMSSSSMSHGSEALWKAQVLVSRMVANVSGANVVALERFFYSFVNYSSSIPTPIPPYGTYGNLNIVAPVVDLTGY